MSRNVIKIAHILEGFLGGTSTYVCSVLPQLARKGFDVTLICSLNRRSPDALMRLSILRQNGVKVHIIAMQRNVALFKDVRSFVAILRLLWRGGFDVVHTHCSKAGALGRTAARLTGCRVILHSPHCFAFLRTKGRLKKSLCIVVERLLGRLTTRLTAVSFSEARAALSWRIVPAGKCVTVNNGLNGRVVSVPACRSQSNSTRQKLGLEQSAQVVATACRLVEYKGVGRFLEAARLCRTPNVVFLIAGEGRLMAAANRFVVENKLDQKVRLLGHVSDMERLYRICDVVVLCSDAEAQPYLLLEAMRARRPIVATAVVGNSELILHCLTGLLAEPKPASIAAALEEMLGDKDKRAWYAENAYAYFCRHHTLSKQVSQLARIYRESVHGGQYHRS